MEEDLKAELTCPICMDLFQEPRRLPCGHVYCRLCLQDMLTRKYLNTRASERILSCPECRQRYDLTFQAAGVDVFPRDFKLVRLVELCERKFPPDQSNAGAEGGAEAGSLEQTTVKRLCSTSGERQDSPSAQPTSSLSTTSSPTATSTPPPSVSSSSQTSILSREPNGSASLPSVGSPAGSLSDDSWLFVAPETSGVVRGARPLPPSQPLSRPPRSSAAWIHRHERGNDSWLLPSSSPNERRFPVDLNPDVRGSAGVDYRLYPGGEGPGSLNLSGQYDNEGGERFQRFVLQEPVVQVVHQPASRPPVSPSSESSDSDTSDERGGEVSEEEEESESGSCGQRESRHSRLSRFFRSLVLSDSDSYDEEDEQAAARREEASRRMRGLGGEDQHRRRVPEGAVTMATAGPRGDVIGGGSAPQSSAGVFGPEGDFEARAGSSGRDSLIASGQPLQASAVLYGGVKNRRCDANHNAMAANPQGAPMQGNPGPGTATPSEASMAVGGAGRAAAGSAGRARAAIEISDGSDDDYEAQTSMLRPRRKPRSRLKKFFTSLLSLSSSDDDDEDIQGQGHASSSNTTPDRI